MKFDKAPFLNLPPLPQVEIDHLREDGIDGYPVTPEWLREMQVTDEYTSPSEMLFWFATPSLVPYLILQVLILLNGEATSVADVTEESQVTEAFAWIMGGGPVKPQYVREYVSALTREQQCVVVKVLQYLSTASELRATEPARKALELYWRGGLNDEASMPFSPIV